VIRPEHVARNQREVPTKKWKYPQPYWSETGIVAAGVTYSAAAAKGRSPQTPPNAACLLLGERPG
jgi:hypothetical protein